MGKILLLILISVHLNMYGSKVEDSLKSLTYNERFYLNKFFRSSIRDDHFGFTIFFDKPVSLSGYFIRCRSDELASPYRNKLIRRGWAIWKKYEHLFPHKNFIFCEECEDCFDKNLNFTFKICHIYLINKAALLRLLKSQEATFTTYLGKEFSPESFLTKIENTKTLMPHLNNSELLLGIVLGYGLESALKFEERQRFPSYPPVEGNYQPIVSRQPDRCKIGPIVFMGAPESLEVQSIQEHYSDQIEKIWNIYKDKNFLFCVVKGLCSNDKIF